MQHSEKIGELAAALAKARTSFEVIVKDKSNPAFPKSKYADLENVIGATFKALSENGLAIVQSPGSYSPETHCARLTTTLLHASGEWITDTMEMPVGKVDSWGVGSACTYARRYSYQAFVNVAAEPDDDGAASREEEKAEIRKPQALNKPAAPIRSTPENDPTEQYRYGNVDNPTYGDGREAIAEQAANFGKKHEWVQKAGNISEPQAKRIFGIGKGRGKSNDWIREFLGSHGYTETNEIPKGEIYSKICSELEIA